MAPTLSDGSVSVSVADLNMQALGQLIDLAVAEDLGDRGDITTQIAGLRVAPSMYVLVARQEGVVAGKDLLDMLLARLAPAAHLLELAAGPEGMVVEPGTRIARIECPAEQMLTAERTVLNFLGRLSGVATLTAQYVAAVAGTGASIYDTRKTLPGWRHLDKYAVRCGGGCNHRTGLYDAVLIKDNHVAGMAGDDLADAAAQIVARARLLDPPPTFVEFEVDDLDQFQTLLGVGGIDVLMLDNFSTDDMRQAVRLRDAMGLAGRLVLEASGGVNLHTVRAIAETGVDRISVGALTHSAPVLDLALDAI